MGGDVIYVGKAYADEVNLAWCDPYVTANVKAGVDKNALRIELFMKNLFDDKHWTGCARWKKNTAG